MDKELKESMEHVCKELGLNLTVAFTIFAKKMTREKRIPFDIALDSFYSESNMKALSDSMEQMRQGKVISFTMEELEAMEDMSPEEARNFVDQRKKQKLSS
jgi:DNA-damage-inducible protein J